MTREKAIKELEILKEDYWDDDGYGHETKQYVDTMLALDMAIKALEQEPCDDCISREQAKGAIRDRFKDLPSRVEINTILNELPSVTPQPKMGRWIMTSDYLTTAYGSVDYVKCSCCGEDSLEEGDYCPNCGAEMEVDE